MLTSATEGCTRRADKLDVVNQLGAAAPSRRRSSVILRL
jgi:hypothetical protein